MTRLIIPILLGTLAGYLSMKFQAAFISRRDTYVNSSFAIKLKKLGWFFGGFVMGFALGDYFN
jgi:hypothetical protein